MTPAAIQIDRDLLVELYVNRGLSPAQIAAELAVGVRTVRGRLSDHRLPARPMGRPKGTGRPVLRPEKILTRRYLLDAYHRRGLSMPQIAAEAGFATKTVLKYLRLHGIPTRPSGANSIQRRKVDAERLAALRQQGLSVAEIAARVGCAQRTVVASFHRYNMDLPRGRIGADDIDPQQLAAWRRQGLTVAAMAYRLGCSKRTVERALPRNGV